MCVSWCTCGENDAMRFNGRMKLLCAIALGVGGYIVLFPADPNTVQPTKGAPSVAASRRATAPAASHRAFFQFTDRVADAAAAHSLFASHTWYVAPPPPPPPPQAAAVPVIPTAPPLPFSYM